MQDVVRVALYPRVSTEEQVLNGYSLDAQEEELIKYANDRGYKIVGIYRDEGFSARKPVLKRKVMQELLHDVEAGKIDLIIFTKLDRWFRSIRDYYAVQTILDKHKVAWKTTLEDYQTETADGRLKVNIMLSVAENEADRTSERIRFVFNSRIQNGEYVYGGVATPFGYTVEIIDGVRKLVKDPETVDAMAAFWDKMIKYRNTRRAGRETNLEFGLSRAHKSWMATVRNEVYAGTLRGVQDFCESYISREDWQSLQNPKRMIKSAQGGRFYLFVGLLRCPVCGNTLKATYKTYPNDRAKEYYGYRCNAKSLGYCTYGRQLSERKVEKYLLANVRGELDNYIWEIRESAKKKRRPKIDVPKLQEQLRRLNNVYMSGNMEDSEYNEQAATIKAAIAKATQDEGKKDNLAELEGLRDYLYGDFLEVYKGMTREEKQRFWNSIIEEIRLDDNKISRIIFK